MESVWWMSTERSKGRAVADNWPPRGEAPPALAQHSIRSHQSAAAFARPDRARGHLANGCKAKRARERSRDAALLARRREQSRWPLIDSGRPPPPTSAAIAHAVQYVQQSLRSRS